MKERNEFVSYCNKDHLCIHIESVNLSDGIYELVPASNHSLDSAVLNQTELVQDRAKVRKSPRLVVPKKVNPSAFDLIISIYLFNLCCNNFICAFKFSRHCL